MSSAEEAVEEVLDALDRGRLSRANLTARGLGALLGHTTGHLYHHFGSLDGLLFAVVQRGYQRLGERLLAAFAERRCLGDLAEAFVDFCVARPALYGLMFEHPFDWKALRDQGALRPDMPGLSLWGQFVDGFAQLGAKDAATSTRILMAGLHGLVSFVLSGRANIGATEKTDREVAVASARRLAKLIRSELAPPTEDTKETLYEPSASPAATAPAARKQSPGKGGAHRKHRKPRRRTQ
jgi:AcrR family transcriptional regulator